MVNWIRTLYPGGLNKGFGSKFCVGSQVWQETPEENWRMHWLKHCESNNKHEDNSSNTLSFISEIYTYACMHTYYS